MVADSTGTDSIMMIGITVDSVTMDTSLPVTVDLVMAVDSVMVVDSGMAAASPILVADTVEADPTGHQIVRRYFTPSI
jgi:hypothetical protein